MTKNLKLLLSTIQGRFSCNEETAMRIHDTALRLHSDYQDVDEEYGLFILSCAKMMVSQADKIAELEQKVDSIQRFNQFEGK